MKKIFFLLIYILITIAFGYVQAENWTGKYQLAYNSTKDSILLQVVADKAGSGTVSQGSAAYINFPVGSFPSAVVGPLDDLLWDKKGGGTWDINVLSLGLDVGDCGMVIECDFSGSVGNTTDVVQKGDIITLVKFKIPTDCTNGIYRLYQYYEGDNDVVLGYDICDDVTGVGNGLSINGVTLETNSLTGFLTTSDNPLVCVNDAQAWMTIGTGNWDDGNIWKYWNGTDWIAGGLAPYNSAPIYIYNDVTILVGTTITSSSKITIEPSGKLMVLGTLNIDNKIIFKIDSTGNPGELTNGGCSSQNIATGVIRSTASTEPAKIIVRKVFDKGKWSFISFPFEISGTNIFKGGTINPVLASWGDPGGTGKDFYAAQYSGAKRADATVEEIGATSAQFFEGISPQSFEEYKGYIVTSAVNDSIDFVASPNTSFNFCGDLTKSLTYETAAGSTPCNSGWNLVGIPFVSSYNINYANLIGSATYYIPTITENTTAFPPTSTSTDKTVTPFSAFFIHLTTTTTTQTLTYGTSLQLNTKGVNNSSPSEELVLNYSNGSYADKATIRLKDDAISGFDIEEDAIKILSSSVTVPQIYTELDDACGKIAINSLPTDTKRVNLVVRNGAVGDFSIGMSELSKITNLKQAILVDTETGLRTDLLETSYTYNNTVPGTSSSRFYILFSPDNTTDIAPNGNSDISVIPTGRNIRLNGLKGVASVNMYDVVGKLIYQYTDIAEGQSFNVNVPGIYIMDISTESQRERIKILINN